MADQPYYGGNDGNSINRNIRRKVDVKIEADTKEAIRSIRDLERQVDKLGDMADQGQRRQGGFLSSKQVQMYKQILKEIEQTYQQHQKNMQKLDQQYNSAKNSAEAKKMKSLSNELNKREQLYRNSQGGNKWGDVSSPLIQEYHRNKLKEAQDNYNAYKNSDEYKSYRSTLKQVKTNRDTMRTAIDRINDERTRSELHSSRIDNMYERDPKLRKYTHAMAHTIADTGAITSFGAYWHYTQNGIDLLRQQERSANTVALQGGIGGANSDRLLRNNMYDLGLSNNYSVGQTTDLQSLLIQGGWNGNQKNLSNDTNAIQKFARSYAMDANSVAGAGVTMQQMGTFSQGEQQKFAEMIAGAIQKGGMSGRQAELIQSAVTLAQNVAQGQPGLTQQQFANTLGLQTALGNAVPSLKGQAGTQLLSTMDAAIKGGNTGLDLLMGRGTNPQFSGLQGMYNLKLQQEQGLANPKNLQEALQGAKRMFGNTSNAHAMTGFALEQSLGLPLNDYEALSKSGLLDKLAKDPSSISAKDLQKAGATTLAKQWQQYQGSQTAKVDSLDAHQQDLQASNAKGADAIAKTARGGFYGLGTGADIALMGVGGLGLGLGAKLAGIHVGDIVANTWNKLAGRRIGSGRTPTPPEPPTPSSSSGIVDQHGNPISSAEEITASESTAGKGAGLLSKLKGFGVDALEAGAKVLPGAMPVVGGIAETAIDRTANPQHSWGRSIAKGIGSAVGTGLGILASGAIDVGTGGLGIATNAGLTVGGGMAGSWAGDKVYSLFAGNSDEGGSTPSTPSSSSSSTSTPVPQQDDTSSKVKIANMQVDNVYINNKKLEDVLNGGGDGSNGGSGGGNGEKVIRIIIEGNIQGMDSSNQSDVKNSITSYFNNQNSGLLSSIFKYNLSLDQSLG